MEAGLYNPRPSGFGLLMADSVCPPQGPEADRWVREIVFADTKWSPPFEPSNNLNHSACMEKKIEEMGLETWENYLFALNDIVLPRTTSLNSASLDLIAVGVKATPYERIQAVWKVMND